MVNNFPSGSNVVFQKRSTRGRQNALLKREVSQQPGRWQKYLGFGLPLNPVLKVEYRQ